MSLLLDALNKAQRQSEPSSEHNDGASSTLDLGDIPDLDVSSYAAPRTAKTRDPQLERTDHPHIVQSNSLHSVTPEGDANSVQSEDAVDPDESANVHEHDIEVRFGAELTLEPSPAPIAPDDEDALDAFAINTETSSESEPVSALQQTIQNGVLADLEADLQRIQSPADSPPPSNKPQKTAIAGENKAPVLPRGPEMRAGNPSPPSPVSTASAASIAPPKVSTRSVAKRLFAAKTASTAASHRPLYLFAAVSTIGLLAGAAYVYSVTQTSQFAPTMAVPSAPPVVTPPAETTSAVAGNAAATETESPVTATQAVTSTESVIAVASMETIRAAPPLAQQSSRSQVSAPLEHRNAVHPAASAEEDAAEEADLPDFDRVAQPVARAYAPHPAPQANAPRDAAPLIRVTRSESPLQVNALVAQAYQAFQNADWQTATERYQSVLRGDANNRDALLGLAAIAVQHANLPIARSYYTRLLQLDANDSVAVAGLQSVASGAAAPGSESEIKSLIAKAPGVAYLHFSLGNVYVSQERWPDAERSFFEAYRLEKTRPDYAYNLAVSLDHLGQSSPALHYYETALTLAATTAAGFDVPQATLRAKELRRAVGVNPP